MKEGINLQRSKIIKSVTKHSFHRYSRSRSCNLSWILAEDIASALKAFLKSSHGGCPCNYSSLDEWNKAIQKIIYAFSEIANDYAHQPLEKRYKNEEDFEKEHEMYFNKIKEGKKIFIDNFEEFWY